jgi:AmiR/NasT family two-component response regulator
VSYGFSFPTQESVPSPDEPSTELAALREEIHQLQNAGTCRHEVGIAQGMLMVRHGIDQDQAYAMLSRRCREQGVHVRVVAQAVIGEMGGGVGQPRDPNRVST